VLYKYLIDTDIDTVFQTFTNYAEVVTKAYNRIIQQDPSFA